MICNGYKELGDYCDEDSECKSRYCSRSYSSGGICEVRKETKEAVSDADGVQHLWFPMLIILLILLIICIIVFQFGFNKQQLSPKKKKK